MLPTWLEHVCIPPLNLVFFILIVHYNLFLSCHRERKGTANVVGLSADVLICNLRRPREWNLETEKQGLVENGLKICWLQSVLVELLTSQSISRKTIASERPQFSQIFERIIIICTCRWQHNLWLWSRHLAWTQNHLRTKKRELQNPLEWHDAEHRRPWVTRRVPCHLIMSHLCQSLTSVIILHITHTGRQDLFPWQLFIRVPRLAAKIQQPETKKVKKK